MVDIENKKIENAISFYMLANKLKYVTADGKQSLADQVYGSMVLATAINSEYNIVDEKNLGIVLRMILLGIMRENFSDEMKDCLCNLNEGLLYTVEACEYFDAYRWKSKGGNFAFHCETIEHQLENFFEQFLIEENIQTDSVEELYNIARNYGITDSFGNDEKKNFEIFRFYYLNMILKQKVRSGWNSTHWNISNERIERISEHCVGTIALAIALKSEFGFDIDLNKVISTLCVHEVGEIKIGDITPFDDITPEQKQEIEHQAIIEVIGNLQNRNNIINSIFEFDKKYTDEAKFAYYCDKLEADLQSKVYQDMGCHHPLTEQQNNVVFKSAKVQKMVQEGATTAFDIWYEYDKSIYTDEPVFTKVLKYVKDNNINS